MPHTQGHRRIVQYPHASHLHASPPGFTSFRASTPPPIPQVKALAVQARPRVSAVAITKALRGWVEQLGSQGADNENGIRHVVHFSDSLFAEGRAGEMQELYGHCLAEIPSGGKRRSPNPNKAVEPSMTLRRGIMDEQSRSTFVRVRYWIRGWVPGGEHCVAHCAHRRPLGMAKCRA